MARTRKLLTDDDFQEAMNKQFAVRVFEHDHLISAGGRIIRFDDNQVVIQQSISDIAYHARASCDFFETR
ncbi:hypothetical protein DUZ99_19275 [Xylanibacillus composti]|uniref:Uncharacterized protein n=1 Tax=Xylanibacillus composti TaxID=1572762 RepID=A0A8J4M1H9_9BACL|nr:hypothetical protein [Xylanibacillus composti]MDT9727109.1 hypothetical protein [Xylanibacillus composti]GIQ68880.1 hypothetical protein XYCOK13_17040 [Xylanibacillus composti]